MTYDDNRTAFLETIGTRKYNLLETVRKVFWIQDDGRQVHLQHDTVPKSLRIENSRRFKIGFIPMDGETGVFSKGSPPVTDENRFKYLWFNNNRYEEKTAGPCDCLLIDQRWRFFELKTEAFTQNDAQAEQEREKASLQLARTITFFREQAVEKKIQIDAAFEAVIAFPSRFPAAKAAEINRPVRFFNDFKARLVEVKTDSVYGLD